MKAKKENKIYRITTDMEKKRYLKEGFDIYDDEDNILEHSPSKKIEYGKYVKLQEENAALKAENEALRENIGDGNDDSEVIVILSAYAAEHGIELGKASTVSGIVKKINNSKAGE